MSPNLWECSAISLSYNFCHTSSVNVHVQKISRVFSNIFGNAVQAISGHGQTWFNTVERDGFIEFTVGNSGSLIPAESLPRLFEAFFTSGKKGGTGLGLAIAEKVVAAHGGKIWCESAKNLHHPDGFVEFHFTLPVMPNHNSTFLTGLPAHSQEITAALLDLTGAGDSMSSPSTDKDELKVEAEVLVAAKRLGRSLEVLIVDDEEIYRQGLIAALSRTDSLSNILKITQASNSDTAMNLVAKQKLDLIVTDIDLGPSSKVDGFDLIEAIRKVTTGWENRHCVISVHTNRIVPADQKMAITRGADAFITKPVSRIQLLKLLLQCYQSIEENDNVPRAVEETVARVAVLEDNIFMLEAWIESLKGECEVFGFSNPEEFVDRIESDHDFLGRLSCLVTDLNFDNSTHLDGIDVGRIVKSKRADLSVLLSSDATCNSANFAGAIDHLIPKDAVTYGHLVKHFRDSNASGINK